MTRIRTLFAEALRSIGANVSTTVASALSVLIGMFLIGVFIGLGTWLVSWSDDKKRELAVHVFIADAATTKQVDELRVLLESDERVKPGGITFISKAEALEIMRKRNPELTANLASNPLPASFDVVPKRGEDTEAIAIGVQKLEARRRRPGALRQGGLAADPRRSRARSRSSSSSRSSCSSRPRRSSSRTRSGSRSPRAARDRGDEARRRVQLVRPRAVHARRAADRPRGSVAAVILLFVSREIAIPQILGHIQDDADVRALAFTWTAPILIVGGLAIGALGSGSRCAASSASRRAVSPVSVRRVTRGASSNEAARRPTRGEHGGRLRGISTAADERSPLATADLELLATSAFMLGRDHEYLESPGARAPRPPRGGDARAVRRVWVG